MRTPSIFLKRSLLFFWAAWFTVVFASNLADAAKAAGFLPTSWPFASGNFAFVSETTARYSTPGLVNAVLFGGVIVWEGLASALFWRAFWAYRDWKAGMRHAYHAVIASSLLWMTFIIADEILIAYAVEGTHFRLLVATLVTVWMIEVLPE